jgi:hypothetical protein
MRALHLINGTAYTSEDLNTVGKAFDDAWAEIAHHFDGDNETPRLRLAHAMLALGEPNGRSSDQMKQAALEVMALSYRL